MKPCLNQATINQTDMETCVEASASAGFKGIEFRMPKLQAYAALNHSSTELKQLLKDHDVESVCLNSLEDFCHVPADDFDAVLHRAREFSTICRQTACKMFVCCPSPVPKNLSKAKALEMTADRLGKIAQVGEEQSVGVAFEFLGGASASTLQDAVQVVEASGASNVGLIIDTFHYYVSRSTMDALRDFPLERIWAVHFNDAEPGPLETLTDEKRLLPGKGVIKLHEFVGWLKERGWDGWLSVELFREDYWKRDASEVAKESMESLKPYL
jgi:2-keto-myo-inositol isomerase